MTSTYATKRSKEEWARRYAGFVVILFVIAFGTSLSIRANLGSSPISAPPFILSLVPGIGLTMGTLTIFMHVVFIALQALLLGRDFERRQLSQILVSFLFGVYTDVTMWMTAFLQVPFDANPLVGYPLRFAELLVGGALLAFGIACEVRCDSLMLAGEGLPLALARRLKKDFGRVKICSDTGLVLIGAVFMFVFFGAWDWKKIGVGTLVSMFYVGYMVRVFTPHIAWLDLCFIPKGERTPRRQATVAAVSSPHRIVTIAREYGSGGSAVAERVAQRLGIPCYNRQLIEKTAALTGYTPAAVEQREQNIATSKLWELIFTDKSIPPSMHASKDDIIFVEQSRTIRELAQERSCVIVGRLANWILKDREHVVRVFVTSDCDTAVSRVAEREGLSEEEAARKTSRTNSGRANHYWQYTGGQWTDAHNYDIVVNTDRIGIEGAADLICRAAESSLFGEGNT